MLQASAQERIIVPLDYIDLVEATATLQSTHKFVNEYKLGLAAITAGIAHTLMQRAYGFQRKIGYDGKFDDIPNTVADASKAAARNGVKWFNVHASAGRKSVRAAVQNKSASLVYGVTVLTSLNPEECVSIFGDQPGPKVLQFAQMLVDEKADGIICSAKELALLGADPTFKSLIKTTPGIRPTWASANDQKRVMTPAEAIAAGADYLVIGRPITHPETGSIEEAFQRIVDEVEQALQLLQQQSQSATA